MVHDTCFIYDSNLTVFLWSIVLTEESLDMPKRALQSSESFPSHLYEKSSFFHNRISTVFEISCVA